MKELSVIEGTMLFSALGIGVIACIVILFMVCLTYKEQRWSTINKIAKYSDLYSGARWRYLVTHPARFIIHLAFKYSPLTYDPSCNAIRVNGKYVSLYTIRYLADHANYSKWNQFYCDADGLVSFKNTDKMRRKKRGCLIVENTQPQNMAEPNLGQAIGVNPYAPQNFYNQLYERG